jgi:aminopeptidase
MKKCGLSSETRTEQELCMTDPRIVKLAQVMVHYSIPLVAGGLFRIVATPAARPLVREIYREALLAGAHPLVRLALEETEELLYKYGSDEQITHISKTTREETDEIAATLFVISSENTRYLSGADPRKVALRRQANRELNERFYARVEAGEADWSITLFPTHAAAQDADMSLAEYEDFVYTAGKLDADDPVAAWTAVHDEQQRIADFLGTKQVIRLVAPDTDLTYHTAGRSWINADGRKNFPDGEVFTSPDETKTEGHIRFSFPALYAGREVTDVRLVFKEGKVVQATAAKGEELLHSLLDMDEGARRLGEAAFGTNYQIQRFTRNILFDEKIGGTIHLALGTAFEEVGGRNKSALHWDMICEMRQGGAAYADGELFYQDGKFLI